MPEFLLELFSEEIPARMQRKAAEDLQALFTKKLGENALEFTKAEAHVTPRRLVLMIDGLPSEQPARREERKGPREGSTQAAIDGFLKGAGLKSLDECELRDTPKGKIWFAMTNIPGKKTADVLPALIEATIREMPWPKSMNWAEGSFRWVRPLRSILALFDGAVVAGTFSLGTDAPALTFGDTTEGHRFLGKGRFAVKSFADYKAKLCENFVILERDERKKIILEGATKLLGEKSLTLKDDKGLLEEVCGLVEWPVMLCGRIDDKFMDIPQEVLTTTMRVNQKYFASLSGAKLSPWFVVAANLAAPDGGKVIIGGNERVLRARLADARFFWDTDLKTKLSERLADLDKVTFHAKLGTMRAKAERIGKLAKVINPAAGEAGLLAKADLTTGMVGEFPELQGIMGGYYARAEKLSADVADAVRDHYSPQGPDDACPSAPVTVAVALADKIDTLVGFFGIEELPTGSKDPYALRRAALGIIRLIVENKLRVDLIALITQAHGNFAGNVLKPLDFVLEHLTSFFVDRLKAGLKDLGVRNDLISAVFGSKGAAFDITAQLNRLNTLQAALTSDDGKALLGLYRRASNIIRIEEKKDGKSYSGTVNWILFKLPDEKTLAQALADAAPKLEKLIESEDYAEAMRQNLGLRPTLDSFFTNVMVNDQDGAVRENRLRLLAQIRDTLDRMADFSQVEGE